MQAGGVGQHKLWPGDLSIRTSWNHVQYSQFLWTRSQISAWRGSCIRAVCEALPP